MRDLTRWLKTRGGENFQYALDDAFSSDGLFPHREGSPARNSDLTAPVVLSFITVFTASRARTDSRCCRRYLGEYRGISERPAREREWRALPF